MFAWLNNEGAVYKSHIPNETNYLFTGVRSTSQGSGEEKGPRRPFGTNPHFQSQSILSEDLRNEIWERVMQKKQSVREVSVRLGVDMRRIGAVVRLVELERRMKSEVRSASLPFVLVDFVCYTIA